MIYNAKYLKKINREIVLKTIYNNKPISRADISKIVGLTPPSITKIINEFLKIGLVYEIGADLSKYGRKPILLNINADRFFIIGIYIGRNSISGVITNLDADIKARSTIKNFHLKNKLIFEKACINIDYCNGKVAELIDKLLDKKEVDKDKIIGIGIAVPGPVGSIREKVEKNGLEVGRPGNLVNYISKKYNLPVFADKDSNVSAVGESWFGKGKRFSNFLLVTFGEGIGSGLFLNDRLYIGKDDAVGEIGHTTIDLKGGVCPCGNIGCLELFIKNKAIFSKFKDLVKKYPDSKLGKSNIKKVEDIYNFKDKNDPIYIEIIDHLVSYLALGTVTLVNILNPEAVIFTTNELEDIEIDPIVKKIEKIVRKRALPIVKNKVQLVSGGLKSNSQLIGAIGMVLRVFFDFIIKT